MMLSELPWVAMPHSQSGAMFAEVPGVMRVYRWGGNYKGLYSIKTFSPPGYTGLVDPLVAQCLIHDRLNKITVEGNTPE
jgi:hypothetical protein